MKLIFIYGLPATGKFTVGTELAAVTGFKLFHNHLTVDLLLSVFAFGSPAFVTLREQIWLSVFEQACRSGLQGLVFTFAPEPTVRPGFIPEVLKTLEREGGTVQFIELICPLEELKLRVDTPSRQKFQKLTSLSLLEELHANGSLDTSKMPEPILTLDTSRFTPDQAAVEIARVLRLGEMR